MSIHKAVVLRFVVGCSPGGDGLANQKSTGFSRFFTGRFTKILVAMLPLSWPDRGRIDIPHCQYKWRCAKDHQEKDDLKTANA